MTTYELAALHPALAPYIRTILIQDPQSDGVPAEAPYKILPMPFPVIGLQYRGRLGVLRGSREQLLEPSGITGLQTTFRCFLPHSDARSILVTLEPYGAYALLGCAMDDLADEHIGLGSILSGASVRTVEEQLAEASTIKERSQIVQSFLLALLKRTARHPHPLVVTAAQRILNTHGGQRIEVLAGELGVSMRQLERLFRYQIGVGPKQLASVAQFDWAVAQIAGRVPSVLVASEAGYSDQAHFIRSFVARAGITPGLFRHEAEMR